MQRRLSVPGGKETDFFLGISERGNSRMTAVAALVVDGTVEAV
jgi:hypothetical protein